MKNHDFILDSSIYNGGYEDRFLFRYDFRTVKNILGYWPFTDDVRKTDSNGDLYEIPVLAISMRRLTKFFRWEKLFSALQNLKKVKTTVTKYSKSSEKEYGFWERLLDKVKFFVEMDSQNWDITVVSPGMQKKFLKLTEQLEKKYQRHVFAIIGHPKCLKSTKTLQHLLKWKIRKGNCKLVTLTDFYYTEIISSNNEQINKK